MGFFCFLAKRHLIKKIILVLQFPLLIPLQLAILHVYYRSVDDKRTSAFAVFIMRIKYVEGICNGAGS